MKRVPKMSYDQLAEAKDHDLGASRWVLVDQDRIDRFAEVSEDHQWIHVDAERAADGPFGTTVAHGYLTLSLVGTLLGELLDVEPDVVLVNYGLDRIRFLAPVAAGARVRARGRIVGVETTAHGLRLLVSAHGETEGRTDPVCVADAVVLVRR
ncbi:MaoC family dehydratase [Nocardioides humi]|uniref:MaoC family dehydratase n=2 Tax=Nocardioides humi TaxID=449461 RepID=A0ABN2A4V9_9ACTN